MLKVKKNLTTKSFFDCHKKAQKTGMFEKSTKYQEVTNIISALSEVINFLDQCGTVEKNWEKTLIDIRDELFAKESRKKALEKLETCFGGMGSLNDICFCETNRNLPKDANEKEFNAKWNQLLDMLFKELCLAGKSPTERREWEKFEEECRNELPPRVKKAFRSRKQK